MRMALAETFESDQPKSVLRLGAALGFGDRAQGEREFDVLFRGQPGKQAGFLEHHADAIGIGLVDRRAVDEDGSRGLPQQSGEHHQQRRLSAAARPDQDDEPSRLDVERDVRQRHHVRTRSLESLADTVDLDRDGARRRLQRRYVRQWLHFVSPHLTISLKVIAITAIITTLANSCRIWKFSPQLAIWWPMPSREAYISARMTPVRLKIMEIRKASSSTGS